MSSVKKNVTYNIIYQILILIIPLITAPYLSRVVGAKGVGIYSYTYSIVYYFMLLCLLGVNNYGNRLIAKVRDDKEKLSKTFFGVYLFQLFMGIIMLIVYIIYLLCVNNEYKTIALIQSIYILSAMVDINWFFFGLEEFKATITRNTLLKISNVILIFIFVKNNSDLWKYVLIMSGMTLLSQIALWGFLKNKICFVKITLKDITKHIKPNLILFIPVIATSLYKLMDKIMLGSMSSVVEVGYYENAEKIINIPTAIITALGTVMLPRISNIMSKGKKDKVNSYVCKSISFVIFMSMAMSLGLIGIGYNFAPMYFGNEFQKTGILIMLLAITLPFVAFANVIRTEYLIPAEKDRIYIESVILGAIINLIFNIIFIPRLQSVGACIGTILAEITVMAYQSVKLRTELEIKKYISDSIPFLIKAVVMFACVFVFNFININPLLRLMIQIVIGVIIYGMMNLKYILSMINFKLIVRKRSA